MKLSIKRLSVVALALVLMMAFAGAAQATTYYFSGNGTYYASGSGDYRIINGGGSTTYVYRSGNTFYFYKSYVPYHPAPQPTPTPPLAPAPQPTPQPSNGLSVEEQRMFDLLNQARVNAGLRPLTLDMRLVELARKKSQDMVINNYFDHVSPTYGDPFQMMRNAGITYMAAGENLAGAPNADQAHRALMNSPGHRANILNQRYTRVGIGAVRGGPYGMMFTQMFIG